MKHEYCAEYSGTLLRPLHRYDIEYLREWRNRENCNKFLRKIGIISKIQQEQWFNEYIKDSNICFFVIDHLRKKSAGSLALYDFRNSICQIGKIVIEQESRGCGLGKKAFLMTMCIGAEYFDIKEFRLSVHENNKKALEMYERIGFKKIGKHLFENGGYELEMSILSKEIKNKNLEVEKINLFKENDFEDIRKSQNMLKLISGGYSMKY